MKKFLLLLLFVALVVGGSFGLELYTKNFYSEDVFGNYVDNYPNTDIEAGEIIEIDIPIEPVVEEIELKSVSLLAVGDIMFHYPQISAAKNNDNTYNFESVFKYVQKYIESADIALANFETVTAGEERGYSGFPRFNSPKEVIDALKYVGFDILSTANNHSLDQGKTGIISTIDTIEEKGLKNIGTYKDENRTILIEEKNDIKIGFLSYTYGVNGLESLLSKTDLDNMINIINEDKIEADIKTAKEMGAEVIIVYMHWGNEYNKEPNKYQVNLGRKMIEWGANIILGSHPHVIQPTERIRYNDRDNFIIYSMGNFLSNQRLETMGDSYTEDGVMVNIILEKNLDGDVLIKEINLLPTWVYRFSENNKLNYYILPLDHISELELELSVPVMNRIEKSYTDTINTLNYFEYSEENEIY